MSGGATRVGEHGWAISGRHGDKVAPPWAYSVGMWLSCQTPELVLCGMPVENGAAIINAIGARIDDGAEYAAGDGDCISNAIGARSADGADYAAGDVLDDVCPAPLALRQVDVSWRTTNG